MSNQVSDIHKIDGSDLKHFSINTVTSGSTTDFNLYVMVDQEPILYANSPYFWSAKEITRLSNSGYSNLYFQKRESFKVDLYKRLNSCIVDNFSVPKQRIINLNTITAEYARLIADKPLSESALAKGKEISSATIECIVEDLTSIAPLLKLTNRDSNIFNHCGRVAAYCIAIALDCGLDDDHFLKNVALGCLLHDLGKVPNSTEPNSNMEDLGLQRNHTKRGIQLCCNSRLPFSVTQIISHHHERLDGSGYPRGLEASEISTEVRLVAFADVFDNITAKRSSKDNTKPFEILEYIKSAMLNQLDSRFFESMVRILRKSRL